MEQNVFWGINSLTSSLSVEGSPTLILLGGSWFWYPFNNLASARVQASYAEVIAKLRRHNPTAPVVCHNYEKARPSGKGLFGPADWLKIPMDTARIPKALRRKLFVDLVVPLNKAQKQLTQSNTTLGKVVPIQTAGTLPDSDGIWANELHLKPTAFDAMVKRVWLPALKKLGIT